MRRWTPWQPDLIIGEFVERGGVAVTYVIYQKIYSRTSQKDFKLFLKQGRLGMCVLSVVNILLCCSHFCLIAFIGPFGSLHWGIRYISLEHWTLIKMAKTEVHDNVFFKKLKHF